MDLFPILHAYRISNKRLNLLEKWLCVYDNYAMHSIYRNFLCLSHAANKQLVVPIFIGFFTIRFKGGHSNPLFFLFLHLFYYMNQTNPESNMPIIFLETKCIFLGPTAVGRPKIIVKPCCDHPDYMCFFCG
jgi:uncharacterized membrane protein